MPTRNTAPHKRVIQLPRASPPVRAPRPNRDLARRHPVHSLEVRRSAKGNREHTARRLGRRHGSDRAHLPQGATHRPGRGLRRPRTLAPSQRPTRPQGAAKDVSDRPPTRRAHQHRGADPPPVACARPADRLTTPSGRAKPPANTASAAITVRNATSMSEPMYLSSGVPRRGSERRRAVECSRVLTESQGVCLRCR